MLPIRLLYQVMYLNTPSLRVYITLLGNVQYKRLARLINFAYLPLLSYHYYIIYVYYIIYNFLSNRTIIRETRAM